MIRNKCRFPENGITFVDRMVRLTQLCTSSSTDKVICLERSSDKSLNHLSISERYSLFLSVRVQTRLRNARTSCNQRIRKISQSEFLF